MIDRKVTFSPKQVKMMKKRAKEIGVTTEFFLENAARAKLGLPVRQAIDGDYINDYRDIVVTVDLTETECRIIRELIETISHRSGAYTTAQKKILRKLKGHG